MALSKDEENLGSFVIINALAKEKAQCDVFRSGVSQSP
jgi:hypothetical protein